MLEKLTAKTEIGSFEVLLIDSDHALVSTGSGETVTVRNKQYTVSVRVRFIDGEWMPEDERGSDKVRHWTSSWNKPAAAPTIAAKAVAMAMLALKRALEANPQALADAAVLRAEKEHHDALEKVDRLKAELDQALTVLGEAATRLAMRKAAQQEQLTGKGNE